MAIQVQTWKPDTCGCVFEETHDPSDANYGVKFSKVVTKCLVHQLVADANLYDEVYANPGSEQKRKNKIDAYLLTSGALGLSETVINRDGEAVVQYKSGISYNWYFDANRVLNVTISGITLSNNLKNTIRSFCDATFGVGKVVVA